VCEGVERTPRPLALQLFLKLCDIGERLRD